MVFSQVRFLPYSLKLFYMTNDKLNWHMEQYLLPMVQ
jgi:hypothetical protein